MTTDEAGLLIATLAAAYPRQALEPTTIEIYTRSLADLDHPLAAAAVASLIASSRFFPTIAEIRTTAAELATSLPGPAEAWMLALELIKVPKDNGLWASLPIEVREAVKAIGGTWAIRTSENLDTLRAQFRRAYEEIRQRTLDRVVLAGVPALDRPETRELVAARDGERNTP